MGSKNKREPAMLEIEQVLSDLDRKNLSLEEQLSFTMRCLDEHTTDTNNVRVAQRRQAVVVACVAALLGNKFRKLFRQSTGMNERSELRRRRQGLAIIEAGKRLKQSDRFGEITAESFSLRLSLSALELLGSDVEGGRFDRLDAAMHLAARGITVDERAIRRMDGEDANTPALAKPKRPKPVALTEATVSVKARKGVDFGDVAWEIRQLKEALAAKERELAQETSDPDEMLL